MFQARHNKFHEIILNTLSQNLPGSSPILLETHFEAFADGFTTCVSRILSHIPD